MMIKCLKMILKISKCNSRCLMIKIKVRKMMIRVIRNCKIKFSQKIIFKNNQMVLKYKIIKVMRIIQNLN